MDSTRAQLIYDQLLDDCENGREPFIPFSEAVDAWSSQSGPDGYRRTLAGYLWFNWKDKIGSQHALKGRLTELWFVAFFSDSPEAPYMSRLLTAYLTQLETRR